MSAALAEAGAGPRRLENMAITEALHLVPGEEKTVQVSLRGDVLEIHSKDGKGWKRHVTARRGTPALIPVQEPASKIAQRLGPASGVDAFYGMVAERGMNFGPSFRTVREIRSGSRESLAKVAMQESKDSAARYGIHPALLDGCLQILATALPEYGLYLPFAIERVEFYRPASGVLTSHAVLRAGKEKSGSLLFDFHISDDAGAVVLVSGMQMHKLEDGKQTQRPSRPLSYFDISWEPKDRQPAPASAAGETLADCGRSERVRSGFGSQDYNTGRTDDSGVTESPAIRRMVPQKRWLGIIYLAAMDVLAGTPSDASSPADAQRQVCGLALELVQALAAGPTGGSPRLWLVTRGAQMVNPQQTSLALAQSTLWGMAQGIFGRISGMAAIADRSRSRPSAGRRGTRPRTFLRRF